MKKTLLFLFILAVFVKVNSIAQTKQTMYVAAKQGLNIYEKMDTATKVLGKISYGQKINLVDYSYQNINWIITKEGLLGNWKKVKLNNKPVYILDCYLFPVPPPQKDTKTMNAYFSQLSSIAGTVKKAKGGKKYGEKEGEEEIKILYKNGMILEEWRNWVGWGFDISTTKFYTLPGFSVQQAFLLVQLLKIFPYCVAEKDSLPTQPAIKQPDATFLIEKQSGENYLKIEKWPSGDIKSIHINKNNQVLKIYELKGTKQVIIYWNQESPVS